MPLLHTEPGSPELNTRLQKLLSYVFDISLEKSSSPYNPYLEVLLVQGRHQLITKNAVYSFDDKYDNFYQAFKGINWKLLDVQNVLVLGLGLGSVIHMLEHNFDKHFSYDCVEIDPEIIRLAEKYTLKASTSATQVFQTDAMTFVQLCQSSYDLILMDVFQNAEVPEKFESEDFLLELKSLLNVNGLILYNRMNMNYSDKKANKSFITSFSKVFPDYKELPVKDNIVLVSEKQFVK